MPINAKLHKPSAAGKTAEIYIYGDIGADWWAEESVSAKQLVDWLAELQENTPVLCRINSYGGSVADGMAIYNALRNHRGGVTTRVDGVAMSSASLIFMGGESREVCETSLLMVHAPWTVTAGNSAELRETADTLDTFATAMLAAYSRAVPAATAEAWLTDGKDHFFTAEQAIDNGLADITVPGKQLAAMYRKNRFTNSYPNGETTMPPEKTPEQIIAEERERIAALQRIASEYEAPAADLNTAIEAGTTPEAFELAAARAKVAALKETPPAAAPAVRGAFRPTDTEELRPRIEAPHARNRRLRGFCSPQEAFIAGQFARAVLSGDAKAQNWLFQNRGLDVRGASLSSAGTAGVLIPTELENAVVDLREEYGVLRSVARVPTMVSDTLSRPVKKSGLTASPIGETATMTEQDLANMWGKSNLIARKWGVLIRYPSELAEDSIIDLGQDLADDIAMAFSEAEDTAGFSGDGTSAYHGILGLLNKIILAQHAGSVVEATGNTFADVTLTDIAKLMSLVPRRFRRNAAFYASRVGYMMTLGRLKIAAGGNSAGGLSEADTEEFLRYPVVHTETFPSVFTTLAGEVMIAFGDARAACDLGNRRGIRLVESRERFIETDELAMQATERFDVNWHSLGDTANPGPMCALLGKSS